MELTNQTGQNVPVFVSYSREDAGFADQLVAALDGLGFRAIIDRHEIAPGEDWQLRLGNLISSADAVVFIVSDASSQSEMCQWEVSRAQELNKRIIPVICAKTETETHESLQKQNFIHFYDEPKVPGSGFWTGLERLVEGLIVDIDWVREHTRLSELAERWHQRGQPDDLLLQGSQLHEYLTWRKVIPAGAPALSELQSLFLRKSEQAEEKRIRLEESNIAALEAAVSERETAIDQAAEAQRINRRRTVIFFSVSVVLFLGAIWGAVLAVKEYNASARAASAVFAQQADAMLSGQRPDNLDALRFSLLADPLGTRYILDGYDNNLAKGPLIASYFSNKARLLLSEHDDAIVTFCYRPDGQQLLTASADGTAILWGDTNFGMKNELIHPGSVKSCKYGGDGEILLTVSNVGTAHVWDSESGTELVRAFPDETDNGQNPGNSVRVLIPYSETRNTEIESLVPRLSNAYLSPDSEYLITQKENALEWWSLETGDFLRKLQVRDDIISTQMNEQYILIMSGFNVSTAQFNHSLSLFDRQSYELLHQISHRNRSYAENSIDGRDEITFSPVTSMKLSADSKAIIIGTESGALRIYDIESGKDVVVNPNISEDEAIYSSAVEAHPNPKASSILLRFAEGTIVYYSNYREFLSDAGSTMPIPRIVTDRSKHLRWNKDGSHFLSVATDNVVEVWSTRAQDYDSDYKRIEQVASFYKNDIDALYTDFSPVELRVAVASSDGSIRVWENETQSREILKKHDHQVKSVQYNKSNGSLVSVDISGKLSVEFVEPVPNSFEKNFSANVQQVSINAEGTLIAVLYRSPDSSEETRQTSFTTHLDVLSADTGDLVSALKFPEDNNPFINYMVFSPSAELVTSSDRGEIVFWDIESGTATRELREGGSVRHIAFNRNGTKIASASFNGLARVWDVATESQISTFDNHRSLVRSVHFSPDDKMVISTGWDNSARAWDAASGNEIYILDDHSGDITSMGYSSDGRYLATASSDGSVIIWDAETGARVSALIGHQFVADVKFVDGTSFVLTSSPDGTVRLWDSLSGRELKEISASPYFDYAEKSVYTVGSNISILRNRLSDFLFKPLSEQVSDACEVLRNLDPSGFSDVDRIEYPLIRENTEFLLIRGYDGNLCN